jgi:hypothetical protein
MPADPKHPRHGRSRPPSLIERHAWPAFRLGTSSLGETKKRGARASRGSPEPKREIGDEPG